jgi:hypothetical protein
MNASRQTSSFFFQNLSLGFRNFWNWIIQLLKNLYDYITGNLSRIPETPHIFGSYVPETTSASGVVIASHISLLWGAYSDMNYVTGWILQRSDGVTRTFNENVPSYLDYNNIIPGVTYTYTLIAVGKFGNSLKASTTISIPNITNINLSASVINNLTTRLVTLTWSPSGLGSVIYNLYKSPPLLPTSPIPTTPFPSIPNVTSPYIDTDVSGSNYYYYIEAVDNNSHLSTISNVVSVRLQNIPNLVVTYTKKATNLDNVDIKLTWNDLSYADNTPVTYTITKILIDNDPNIVKLSTTPLDPTSISKTTVAANTTPLVIEKDVERGHTYEYQITATGSNGQVTSQRSTVFVPIPSINLTAKVTQNTETNTPASVKLNWTTFDLNATNSYNLYRSEDKDLVASDFGREAAKFPPGKAIRIALTTDLTPSVNTFTDIDVLVGHTYYYVLQENNGQRYTTNSNIAVASIQDNRGLSAGIITDSKNSFNYDTTLGWVDVTSGITGTTYIITKTIADLFLNPTYTLDTTPLDPITTTFHSYTDRLTVETNVNKGHTYKYHIVATGVDGQVTSSNGEITVPNDLVDTKVVLNEKTATITLPTLPTNAVKFVIRSGIFTVDPYSTPIGEVDGKQGFTDTKATSNTVYLIQALDINNVVIATTNNFDIVNTDFTLSENGNHGVDISFQTPPVPSNVTLTYNISRALQGTTSFTNISKIIVSGGTSETSSNKITDGTTSVGVTYDYKITTTIVSNLGLYIKQKTKNITIYEVPVVTLKQTLDTSNKLTGIDVSWHYAPGVNVKYNVYRMINQDETNLGYNNPDLNPVSNPFGIIFTDFTFSDTTATALETKYTYRVVAQVSGEDVSSLPVSLTTSGSLIA